MHYNAKIVVAFYKEHGIDLTPEFKFHPTRKWRFDFLHEQSQVVLEVEGGVYSGGRHTRGSGFVKDIEKYNTATLMGYRVLRCVPNDVCMQETVDMMKEAIAR